MVGRTRGAVAMGIEARIVDVEADVAQGLPAMAIVGLADTAVNEARNRVRSAMVNSEVEWQDRKITVALLPASWKKRGSGLDLAIALAILAATGQVPEGAAAGCLVLGELGLDGSVRPVPGAVAAALAARERGISRILVPTENVAEARLIPGVVVGGVDRLDHLVGVLRGTRLPDDGEDPPPASTAGVLDLRDVRGQFEARRALEIAAAGGHHLSMVGTPGVGKSMLAQRLPGILPPLDDDAAIEVTAIRSASGLLKAGEGLLRTPPFEAPHHDASHVSVVGGGQAGRVSIGAATLAHSDVRIGPLKPRLLLAHLGRGTTGVGRLSRGRVLPVGSEQDNENLIPIADQDATLFALCLGSMADVRPVKVNAWLLVRGHRVGRWVGRVPPHLLPSVRDALLDDCGFSVPPPNGYVRTSATFRYIHADWLPKRATLPYAVGPATKVALNDPNDRILSSWDEKWASAFLAEGLSPGNATHVKTYRKLLAYPALASPADAAAGVAVIIANPPG